MTTEQTKWTVLAHLNFTVEADCDQNARVKVRDMLRESGIDDEDVTLIEALQRKEDPPR